MSYGSLMKHCYGRKRCYLTSQEVKFKSGVQCEISSKIMTSYKSSGRILCLGNMAKFSILLGQINFTLTLTNANPKCCFYECELWFWEFLCISENLKVAEVLFSYLRITHILNFDQFSSLWSVDLDHILLPSQPIAIHYFCIDVLRFTNL